MWTKHIVTRVLITSTPSLLGAKYVMHISFIHLKRVPRVSNISVSLVLIYEHNTYIPPKSYAYVKVLLPEKLHTLAAHHKVIDIKVTAI